MTYDEIGTKSDNALEPKRFVRGLTVEIPEKESRMSRRVQEILANLDNIERLHNRFLNRAPSVSNAIVGTMASFPGREAVAPFTIESVLPQVDYLFLFLNSYFDEPEYLSDLSTPEKVIPILAGDIDLSALGKTFCLDAVKDCFVFSLDDDLLYPSNYVEAMVGLLEAVDNQAIVAAHGSILAWPLSNYYERTQRFPLNNELDRPKFTSLAGSGHLAYKSSVVRPSFWDFYPFIMVDLQYATIARNKEIPIITLPRPKRWLCEIAEESGLFDQMKYVSKGRTYHYFKAVEFGPWTIESFSYLYRNWFVSVKEKLVWTEGYYVIPGYGVCDVEVQDYLWRQIAPSGWSSSDRTSLYDSRRVNMSQLRSSLQTGRRRIRHIVRNVILSLGGSRLLDLARRVDPAAARRANQTMPPGRGATEADSGVYSRQNEVLSVDEQIREWEPIRTYTVNATSVTLIANEVRGFRGCIVAVNLWTSSGRRVTPQGENLAKNGDDRVFLVSPMKRKSRPTECRIYIWSDEPVSHVELRILNRRAAND